MRDTTPPRNQWFKRCAIPALALAVSACSLLPRDQGPLDQAYRDEGERTLGDLKPIAIDIPKQYLKPVPPEQVIDTYQQALALFSQPEERLAILRRMADLTMVGSEDRLLSQLEEEDLEAQQPEVSSDIASQIAGIEADQEQQQAQQQLTYKNAIELYQQVINSAAEDTDLSESYYLLAKAYDLNGQPDKSLETLDELIERFPLSEYRAEAQFRRGEQLFLLGDYDAASEAYKDVLSFGPDAAFYEQSLYKHGWSLYKLGDFDLAVNDFVALLDLYLPSPPPPPSEEEPGAQTDGETGVTEPATAEVAPETALAAVESPEDEAAVSEAEEGESEAISATQQKILDDTLRVTALAFSNLEGEESIQAYFADNGQRHYEVQIYSALASLYLYQERFRDAADTYEAFTVAHPLHPMAPSMSSKVIDTFIKGGFPSLVLPYKERFVTKYGVYSDYWKQATPDSRKLYEKELKQHLVELANHYHAKAQSTKTRPDYLLAARWYREYLTTFPLDTFSPKMNLLLAEVLFAAKDFRAAIEEFERTAYYYPENESSEKAGYFALLSFQEYIKTLEKDDPTRHGWIVKKTSSALQFVKQFPGNKETPVILDNVIEDQLALNDMPGVLTSTLLMIKLAPPPPKKLWDKAWITRANALFDIGRWDEAEEAITRSFELVELTPEQRRTFRENRATAIYKQAEALQLMNQPQQAAAEFLRVAVVEPDSSVRPTAEYDAATILLQLEDWERAIEVLESFRRSYPKHELIATLPAKLSLAYEKTGRWGQAAGELETIAAASKESDPAVAKEASWQAAKLYDRTNNTAKAIALYKSFYWAYEEPFSQRMEAQSRLAELYQQAGEPDKRAFWLDKIVDSYFKGGGQNTAETQLLAAKSASELAEPVFQSYKSIALTQPLKRSLKRKRSAMQATIDAYTRIAEIGIVSETTKSTHRIGEVYRDFAKSIMDSERPRGLDELALEEYDILLEDQALPFEDKAIAIFQTNAERTLEGTWDEWIERSYDSLRKLNPGRYGKDELQEDFIDEIF